MQVRIIKRVIDMKKDIIAKKIDNEDVSRAGFDSIARKIGQDESVEILSPQKRAWITRRMQLKKKTQHNAALKAWDTRRKNAAASANETVVATPQLTRFQIAAQKAWVTRRNNISKNIIKPVIRKNTKWDGESKSEVRNTIAGYFRMYDECINGKVLALESDEFLFTKLLPDCKFDIYEHDEKVYNSMLDTRPPNVNNIIHGDVRLAGDNKYYDCAFLDFCNTCNQNVNRMMYLTDVLKDSIFIAATFALRTREKGMLKKGTQKKKSNLYAADIIKQMQAIFRNHTFEYGMSYHDGLGPMFAIVLKHRDLL